MTIVFSERDNRPKSESGSAMRFRGIVGRVRPLGEAVPYRVFHCISLTDNNLHLLSMITVAASAAICMSPDQPGVIVAGSRTAGLIAIIGKKLVFRDSEIFTDSPRKLIMFNLKNGISDRLQFAESIIDFHLNFNHLLRPK
jgi:hypothetical protein